jgi:hypothetical protein
MFTPHFRATPQCHLAAVATLVMVALVGVDFLVG